MILSKNHNLVLISIFTIAILCSVCLFAAPSGADELTMTLRTSYFIVRNDASKPYMAQMTAETAEEQLTRISKNLGYSLKSSKPFILRVYSTHYAFLKAGGSDLGKFTVGTARSSDQSISVDASSSLISVKEVLAHEITHAVVFRILGSNAFAAPLWFHEGLAKYQSEEYDDSDLQVLADAAGDSGLIPLAKLESNFPKDATALAYAESASAVRLLVKKHGKNAPRVVLDTLAKTGSFDTAMKRASGMTADEFTNAWMKETSRKYGALRISQVASAIVGVVMAILAIMAFFVRRKQKIEAVKRWEAEEFEEALRRQLGNDWWR